MRTPDEKLYDRRVVFARGKTGELDMLLRADLSKPDESRDRLTQLIINQVDARSPGRAGEP